MTRHTIIAVVLISVLLVIPFVSAAEVEPYTWNDDFEDGDLGDWRVDDGNVTLENGVLQVIPSGNLPTFWFAEVYHPSSVSIGTWSFDVRTNYLTIWFSASTHFNNRSAFGIQVRNLANDTDYFLMQLINYTYQRLGNYKVNRDNLWHHIEVTRNNLGQFSVEIDGNFAIGANSNFYFVSEYFILDTIGAYTSLDNVSVISSNTPTRSLVVIETGLLVILVAALVLYEIKSK